VDDDRVEPGAGRGPGAGAGTASPRGGACCCRTVLRRPGPAHATALGLWDRGLREIFVRQVQANLDKGNVYVLYYAQEELQSFVEMTRRCKDRQTIAELVKTFSPAFAALRPLPDAPATPGLVCTGGANCTAANRLLGNEVQLVSAQFLGLLGALATDIVETIPANARSDAETAFVLNAATAMATQLDHWLSPAYFQHVAERATMTPADARDGKSIYFFLDRDLWFMTALSDLAALHDSGVPMTGIAAPAFRSLLAKRGQIGNLFDLFLRRVTLFNAPGGPRAEIDRGFLRNYADSRYAAYTGAEAPLVCEKDATGAIRKVVRVESQTAYLDPDVGWDLSHARRLVPALASFVRNRAHLAKAWGYGNPAFDPVALQHAFARQIVDKIWNQDAMAPLFSNFWDGSNGWYRVGYGGVTHGCQPGEPPYGLAWSFPTGGYPQWGQFNAQIRALNQQLHGLFEAADVPANPFVTQHYAQLLATDQPQANHGIWRLGFLASVVGH